MPHEVSYDLGRSAELICAELARYGAHAVFFVVGRMVEEHPDIVHAIAAAGHEIGLHGYEHDNLSRYDSEALALLEKNLARVGSLAEDITGARPQCFRAPYLMSPLFYRAEVYALLKAQGYRWVSNRYVRYPVGLLRPRTALSLLPLRNAWQSSDGTVRMTRNRPLLAPLNAGLLAKETFGGSPVGSAGCWGNALPLSGTAWWRSRYTRRSIPNYWVCPLQKPRHRERRSPTREPLCRRPRRWVESYP